MTMNSRWCFRLAPVALLTVWGALAGEAQAQVPSPVQAPVAQVPVAAGPVAKDEARMVRGLLSAPSQAGPAAVAQAFVASRPGPLAAVDPSTLEAPELRAQADGHLVRYGQRYRSLRVVGGDTQVRVDALGRVRWLKSDARPATELRALDEQIARGPALDGAAARARFARAAGYSDALLAAAGAAPELVVYAAGVARAGAASAAAGGGLAPRLAYRVELPYHPQRRHKLRAYIDADSGFALAVDNLIRTQSAPACPGAQDAYVYETNPADSALTCVSLSPYLAEDASELANGDVRVLNCLDRNGCFSAGGTLYHFCDIESVAAADQAGHFTAYQFESDTAAEDAFAEVQMFYHVNVVYELARTLGGFDDLDVKPLDAIVNLRLPSFETSSQCSSPSYTGDEALEAFSNAAFVPKDGFFPGFPEDDSIMFGQGPERDYAYDGDVIYHEFGHAVMAKIAPDLPSFFIDGLGLNSMPGGMHEGYADLMTIFVTDDPEVGEYVAGEFGSDAVRDVENGYTCPLGLTGEVHDDSLPFTGAMWEAREAVASTAERKRSFDQAVFAAQATLGSGDDFGDAAERTVAEVAQALDAQAAATVESVFTARGLLGDDTRGPCSDRVIDAAELTDLPYLYLVGIEYFGGINQVPGPVQFRYELSERAGAILLDIAVAAPDAGLVGPEGQFEPLLEVLVNESETPIIWGGVPTGVAAATSSEPEPVEFEDIPDRPGLTSATVKIPGPFEPGVYHLQFTNRGRTWLVAGLHVYSTPPKEGGCQVSPGGRSRDIGMGILFLLGVIAMFVRWRRSAGRMRRLRRGSDERER
ncbi:hypothetical protein Hoch_5011 [Haliangium ochraceum DSM 14365]|uniref:FTP domain-containing protein n=2 Tax=Haliangium ochraceum TaxID=80816 RepID=D0LVD9_HALO1|nr:hypothetical protein Hoch_5011 [Haliangium ochraceum DSM 14365]